MTAPPPDDRDRRYGVCDVDVYIRRVSTGEVRVHKDRGMADIDVPGEISTYIWRDGNYGCDCNRSDFWHDAGGTSDEDTAPCGCDLYRIDKIVRTDTGETIYGPEGPDA